MSAPYAPASCELRCQTDFDLTLAGLGIFDCDEVRNLSKLVDCASFNLLLEFAAEIGNAICVPFFVKTPCDISYLQASADVGPTPQLPKEPSVRIGQHCVHQSWHSSQGFRPSGRKSPAPTIAFLAVSIKTAVVTVLPARIVPDRNKPSSVESCCFFASIALT